MPSLQRGVQVIVNRENSRGEWMHPFGKLVLNTLQSGMFFPVFHSVSCQTGNLCPTARGRLERFQFVIQDYFCASVMCWIYCFLPILRVYWFMHSEKKKNTYRKLCGIKRSWLWHFRGQLNAAKANPVRAEETDTECHRQPRGNVSEGIPLFVWLIKTWESHSKQRWYFPPLV